MQNLSCHEVGEYDTFANISYNNNAVHFSFFTWLDIDIAGTLCFGGQSVRKCFV